MVAVRRADGPSPRKVSASDVPLSLPSGSDLDAVYRFDWPVGSAAHPPYTADDALRLYYLRFGLRTKLNLMLPYFRRQMKSCLEHSLSDGIWLEGLTESAAGDRSHSTDVWIAHSQTGSAASSNEERELSIEILFIEIGKPHE